MKLLEFLYSWKTVSYYGYNLLVPGWANYLACDMDGSCYAFSGEPLPDHSWWYDGCANDIEKVAIFNLDSVEWTQTLKEV